MALRSEPPKIPRKPSFPRPRHETRGSDHSLFSDGDGACLLLTPPTAPAPAAAPSAAGSSSPPGPVRRSRTSRAGHSSSDPDAGSSPAAAVDAASSPAAAVDAASAPGVSDPQALPATCPYLRFLSERQRVKIHDIRCDGTKSIRSVPRKEENKRETAYEDTL